MRKCLALVLALAMLHLAASPATAADGGITPKLVQYASLRFGNIYSPDASSPKKHIGILLMHPNSNYLNHIMAVPLASRGFTVMTANTRYGGHVDGEIVWDNAGLDVKAAVDYLMAQPGVTKLVLIGHSGGGPLFSFYQNIAENGAKAGQGPEKILPVSDKLDGLRPAEALVLLDAHLGYGFASLMSNDPSVTAEGAIAPAANNYKYNMYREENGFSPAGKGSTYPDAWLAEFFKKQGERSERLLSYALDRKIAIDAGEGYCTDTEPMMVPRRVSRVFFQDLRILSRTKRPRTLLTVNGTREEVIRSLRSAGVNNTGSVVGFNENNDYEEGVLATDVVAYLSTHSIRTTGNYRLTEDDILGVDWASSNTGAPANLAGVRVPVLNIGMTGHYWIVASELNHESTGSADKTLLFVEGATHGLREMDKKYGDTVGMIADQIVEWLKGRVD